MTEGHAPLNVHQDPLDNIFSPIYISRLRAAHQIRLWGLSAGAGVRGGRRDQPGEGQLRQVLHLHLQRGGEHRLERQLYGAPDPEDHQHQVRENNTRIRDISKMEGLICFSKK